MVCKELMARTRNKITVEWVESKDKGIINCVNIKHVLGDLSSVMEGTESWSSLVPVACSFIPRLEQDGTSASVSHQQYS